jgi:hypothetical protein
MTVEGGTNVEYPIREAAEYLTLNTFPSAVA